MNIFDEKVEDINSCKLLDEMKRTWIKVRRCITQLFNYVLITLDLIVSHSCSPFFFFYYNYSITFFLTAL